MEDLVLKFKELEWVSPMPGLRKKEIIINGKKLRLVEFSEDFVEPEWCMRGHVGYIIEGRMTVDFNGSKVCYEKGDGVFIPEGEQTKHKASIRKSEKALVFLVENA